MSNIIAQRISCSRCGSEHTFTETAVQGLVGPIFSVWKCRKCNYMFALPLSDEVEESTKLITNVMVWDDQRGCVAVPVKWELVS